MPRALGEHAFASNETLGLRRVASPTVIWYQFNAFTSFFYDTRKAEGYSDEDLNMMPVPEYIDFIRDWIAGHESPA